MDPRVKTSAAGLQKKFQTESRLAGILNGSSRALLQGATLQKKLEELAGAKPFDVSPFVKKLTALLGTAGAGPAPSPEEVTLRRVNEQAGTLYQAVWQVDAEPTSSQTEALVPIERDSATAEKRWSEFTSADLPELNRMLRDSKVPEIQLEAHPHHEDPQVDEE
jgi:hypothetical protein